MALLPTTRNSKSVEKSARIVVVGDNARQRHTLGVPCDASFFAYSPCRAARIFANKSCAMAKCGLPFLI
jgi:hypothetical protein